MNSNHNGMDFVLQSKIYYYEKTSNSINFTIWYFFNFLWKKRLELHKTILQYSGKSRNQERNQASK